MVLGVTGVSKYQSPETRTIPLLGINKPAVRPSPTQPTEAHRFWPDFKVLFHLGMQWSPRDAVLGFTICIRVHLVPWGGMFAPGPRRGGHAGWRPLVRTPRTALRLGDHHSKSNRKGLVTLSFFHEQGKISGLSAISQVGSHGLANISVDYLIQGTTRTTPG